MQTAQRLRNTRPAELARVIRARIEAGRCATHPEVIRQASRAWQALEAGQECDAILRRRADV